MQIGGEGEVRAAFGGYRPDVLSGCIGDLLRFSREKGLPEVSGISDFKRDAPILGCDSGRDDERRVPQYEKPVRYFFRDLPGVTDAISKNTAGFVKNPLSVIETVPGTSCGSRQIGAIGTFEDGGSGAFEGERGDRQCEERNIPEGGTGSAKEAQRGEPEDGNGNPERKLYGVYMSRDGSRKRDAEGEEPGDTETGELKGSSSCSCLKEEAESGMYTLVNQEFFNGAVILLFPDLLEEFARYVKADLVILPSSVEELICLIRTKNMNYGRLRGIVRTINGTCVGINEKLSDNLYLYRRGEKRIEIISEG